jgi:ribosomal protein S12 methylthiotransferase accessory factor
MDMKITFPGGKKVNAEFGEMVIKTDQPKLYGGEGTAPASFALFLASLGTCAGFYVLAFCQERKIPIEGIELMQRLVYTSTPEGKSKLDSIVIQIFVPHSFPDKYLDTLVKVVDQCAVKQTIMNPPKFEIRTIVR